MTERENVIEWLDFCIRNTDGSICECEMSGCPYLGGSDFGNCFVTLMNDALALLKAQEPVEPKKSAVELAGLRTWDWACPKCNCILAYRANYCSCCGRAVKWE